MDEHPAPKKAGPTTYRITALLVLFIAAALLALVARLLPGRLSKVLGRIRGTAGTGRGGA